MNLLFLPVKIPGLILKKYLQVYMIQTFLRQIFLLAYSRARASHRNVFTTAVSTYRACPRTHARSIARCGETIEARCGLF